ncbi:MAG: type 1 glutamine amidotransferase domain-containing protein [Acholeplasmataceae bacterium]
MKRIAILVENLYDDFELYYPYYRLLEEGFTVDLMGVKKGEAYKSKHGLPAITTHAVTDVKASDYDGLVIPGGFSPDYMRRSKDIIAFVRNLDALEKPIASICHGPWLMISACNIKGKKLTCYHSIKDDVVNAGALYVDDVVVVDGNYVTSRTPKDLPIFVKTFISKL